MAIGFPERVPPGRRPGGREVGHHIGTSTEGGGREAAAHDLAEGHEVGLDPVDAVPPGAAGPEACHDLVGDIEGAVLPAGVLQPLVEAGQRRDDAHVAGRGLGDHAGDLTGEAVEGLVDGLEVVVGQDDRVAGLGAGDAGGVGKGEGRDPGPGGGEQRVDVPVVAPGELDHLGPLGEPAGEPDGGHGGLGATGNEPHLLQRLDPVDHLLGERDLALTGRTERGTAGHGVLDGGDHVRVGVPEDHGTPGADEVDVLTSVGVGQVRAAAGHHEPGRSAHGAEGTDRGVHAAGRDGGRTVEQGLRGRCFVRVGRFAHGLRLLRPSRAPIASDLLRVGQREVTAAGPPQTGQPVGARPRSARLGVIHTAHAGRGGRGLKRSRGQVFQRTFRRAAVGEVTDTMIGLRGRGHAS